MGSEAGDDRVDYTYLGDVSTLVRHPHDAGVWLGAAGALDALPDEVDAVVSLCRVGSTQVPEHIRHRVEVRLIDNDDPAKNPNLDFVLTDTVAVIAALRAEGHTVLLHCAQAQSRTPSVAALYAALHLDVPIEQALAEVCAVLPLAHPKRFLRAAVTRLGGGMREDAG
jgi:ADP-ribosyl-[dinitrogen reductase] hydrolase